MGKNAHFTKQKKKGAPARWLAVAATAAMLWACTPPAAAQETYAGVDISVWQGEVDFAALAGAGVEIVYMRGAESIYTDENFETNFAGATAAGLKVGVYHYMNAETTDQAEEQARDFAALLAGRVYDCRPAMDYETFGGRGAASVSAIAQAYLTELEALLGQRPMVYSDADNAQTLWASPLAAYPLWVADYASSDPPTGPWADWAGFQYSDAGTVAGISTRVDLDVFTDRVLLSDEERPPCPVVRHTVVAGDTLWALACRYGTTVEAIARLNHIANPNFILIGWVLSIPTCG